MLLTDPIKTTKHVIWRYCRLCHRFKLTYQDDFFESILTTFKMSTILESDGVSAKIDSSQAYPNLRNVVKIYHLLTNSKYTELGLLGSLKLIVANRSTVFVIKSFAVIIHVHKKIVLFD